MNINRTDHKAPSGFEDLFGPDLYATVVACSEGYFAVDPKTGDVKVYDDEDTARCAMAALGYQIVDLNPDGVYRIYDEKPLHELFDAELAEYQRYQESAPDNQEESL